MNQPTRARFAADERMEVLRAVRLFAGLGEKTLLALAQASRGRSLAKGQLIFSQDEPGDTVYVVRRGCVMLVVCTVDGRELIINEMNAGDVFGELSVLTGQPRSTSAVANEPSEVAVLPGPVFLAALEAEPVLMRRVLDVTARRLHASTERERALAFMNAPARLARFLLLLDHQTGVDYITISQEDLAQRVALTRQTVAKTLGLWRRAGWLITGRGKIVLLDRTALSNTAEANVGGDGE